MFHPEITRQLAAEHRRDMQRDAETWRMARAARAARKRGGGVEASVSRRLWEWMHSAVRHRRTLPSAAAYPSVPVVPAQRRPADPVAGPSTGADRPISFVGTRVSSGSRYVVGCDDPAVGVLPYPGDPVARATHPVHAVTTAGYPVCGASRVGYVLLQSVWTSTTAGACERCAAAIVGQPHPKAHR